MENLQFYALNGRVKGDVPGNFTSLNKSGKSTIDLSWVNVNCLDIISHFKITPTLTNSPHSLCIIHLSEKNLKTPNISIEPPTYETKFTVNEHYNYQFQSNLNNLNHNDDNVDNLCKNLEAAIKESAAHSGMLIIKNNIQNAPFSCSSNQPWLNKDCAFLKTKLQKLSKNVP